MPNTTWNKAHDIGVPCIDEEHRQLVGLVSQIQEGLQTFASEAEIKKLFAQLGDSVTSHFQHEEKLFEGIGYPRATHHLREHKHLLMIFSYFENGVDRTGRYVSFDEQVAFLRGWLMDHLINEDKQLGDYLNAEDRSNVVLAPTP